MEWVRGNSRSSENVVSGKMEYAIWPKVTQNETSFNFIFSTFGIFTNTEATRKPRIGKEVESLGTHFGYFILSTSPPYINPIHHPCHCSSSSLIFLSTLRTIESFIPSKHASFKSSSVAGFQARRRHRWMLHFFPVSKSFRKIKHKTVKR